MAPKRRSGLALAFVVLVACGGGGGGDDDSPLSDSVEDRRRMPSCGAYVVGPDELAAPDRAARDCFVAAFRAGEQKEISITTTTIEGDAIVTLYRVLGPDDIEVFIDSSADKFAAVDLLHQRCRTLREDGNGLAADACSTVS